MPNLAKSPRSSRREPGEVTWANEGPSLITKLGAMTETILLQLGDFTRFVIRSLIQLVVRWPRGSTMLASCSRVGVASVPVVGVTGLFIGMVLAIQSYSTFATMGLETRLGSVINVSLVKELGPVLAATMLAGRVGSAMAAELGTMRVTEQIDALDALGADPVGHLVGPRLVACVVLIPLLTVMADVMGIVGGALVSIELMGVSSYHYWHHSQGFVGPWDIAAGLFKSLFFGAAIAWIGCHRGFASRGGAEGVGRAATEAFVLAFIVILGLDFLLGILWNALYYLVFPRTGAGLY